MQRNIFDMVEGVVQHRVFPDPVARHIAARRAAGGKLDAWVYPAHHLGRFDRDAAIFGRRLGPHLPRSVHLVAETPELDVVRFLPAMRAAQVGQRRATRVVAILDHVARLVACKRAKIDREHRLHLRRTAPVDELIGAEGVGLGGEPGQIEPLGPLRNGADPVPPVVARDEIAARIAHDGRAQFTHQRQHILAEALLVGSCMARLVDAAVNAAAEMLHEGAEQARVGFSDREIPVDHYFGVTHGRFLRCWWVGHARSCRAAVPRS